jgi:hypothetical protein
LVAEAQESYRASWVLRPPALWLAGIALIHTIAGAAGEQQCESDDC